MTALTFVVNLMRGSKRNPSVIGMPKCGVADWSTIAAFLAIAVSCAVFNIWRVRKENKHKAAAGVDVDAEELDIEQSTQLLKLVLGSLGGGLAGAVGLGGGILFNPVLIGMGVQPQVVSSTGMFMIMFGSLSNSITFHMFEILPLDYALWLSVWCSIGIVIATTLVNKLIRRYQRASIVVFVLALVIGASVVVVPIFNYLYLAA